MNQDKDWLLLLFHWNRLNFWQKKRIVWQARLYKFQQYVYYFGFYMFVFIAALITPFPVRRRVFVRAHWVK